MAYIHVCISMLPHQAYIHKYVTHTDIYIYIYIYLYIYLFIYIHIDR